MDLTIAVIFLSLAFCAATSFSFVLTCTHIRQPPPSQTEDSVAHEQRQSAALSAAWSVVQTASKTENIVETVTRRPSTAYLPIDPAETLNYGDRGQGSTYLSFQVLKPHHRTLDNLRFLLPLFCLWREQLSLDSHNTAIYILYNSHCGTHVAKGHMNVTHVVYGQ